MHYYRKAVYIPYLDSLLQQLKNSFKGHNSTVFNFAAVIPAFANHYSFTDMAPVVTTYQSLLPATSTVEVEEEFSLWQQSRSSSTTNTSIPASPLEALDVCNKDFFPNIYVLLKIFATLPISTAAAERSFSALKRIKDYLRSTMAESRLNGLALMHIHSDIGISPDVVLDKFAGMRRRRLPFII